MKPNPILVGGVRLLKPLSILLTLCGVEKIQNNSSLVHHFLLFIVIKVVCCTIIPPSKRKIPRNP